MRMLFPVREPLRVQQRNERMLPNHPWRGLLLLPSGMLHERVYQLALPRPAPNGAQGHRATWGKQLGW